MKERGSVLVFSVWAIAFLAVFTVVVGRLAASELAYGSWVKNRILLHGLAKAGIERARLEIETDKFIAFDAMNETWASNEKSLGNQPLGAGRFSVECWEGAGGKNSPLYGACDESARLNLNKATEDQLKNLLGAVDEKMDDLKRTEIAESVVDWRDKDDAAMTHGAEATYYKSQTDPYEPRNNDFVAVDELMMVRGMTREIFDKIKASLTVYSEGPVNFNTAGPVAMQALGLSRELAIRVVEFRKGPDGREGTEDDLFFQDPGGITPALSAAGSFSSEQFAQISNAVSLGAISVKSGAFRIHSIGRLIKDGKTKESGVTEESVTCVITRKGQILFWQEGE